MTKPRTLHLHRTLCGGDFVHSAINDGPTLQGRTLCGVTVRVLGNNNEAPHTNVPLNTIGTYLHYTTHNYPVCAEAMRRLNEQFCKNCIRSVSVIDILANTNIGD